MQHRNHLIDKFYVIQQKSDKTLDAHWIALLRDANNICIELCLVFGMSLSGGKGPINFSLISDYGPPPCAPDRPFPTTLKDKLEPATPSVYVRIHCSISISVYYRTCNMQ